MSDVLESSATLWWCFQAALFNQEGFFSRIIYYNVTPIREPTCIGKAVDLDETIRLKALNDPDLERVWVDLQER
jgi:hypothetical protein